MHPSKHTRTQRAGAQHAHTHTPWQNSHQHNNILNAHTRTAAAQHHHQPTNHQQPPPPPYIRKYYIRSPCAAAAAVCAPALHPFGARKDHNIIFAYNSALLCYLLYISLAPLLCIHVFATAADGRNGTLGSGADRSGGRSGCFGLILLEWGRWTLRGVEGGGRVVRGMCRMGKRAGNAHKRPSLMNVIIIRRTVCV